MFYVFMYIINIEKQINVNSLIEYVCVPNNKTQSVKNKFTYIYKNM